jgi:hypothetical protein
MMELILTCIVFMMILIGQIVGTFLGLWICHKFFPF